MTSFQQLRAIIEASQRRRNSNVKTENLPVASLLSCGTQTHSYNVSSLDLYPVSLIYVPYINIQ